MKLWKASSGLAALALVVVGCVGAGDEGTEQEEVGAAAQAQVDLSEMTFSLIQSGITTGSAWAGTIAGGADVEYWAAKTSYAPSAARAISGASQSCTSWKRSVCNGSSWIGSSYYRAVYKKTTLDCGLPPGPCSPSPGAISFLGSGSYKVADTSGTPYAWTYASGSCEYWSMNRLLGRGTSLQSAESPAWTSLSDFESAMCSKSPVPSEWFTVYYEPITCADITC